jgi:hypothetical protein
MLDLAEELVVDGDTGKMKYKLALKGHAWSLSWQTESLPFRWKFHRGCMFLLHASKHDMVGNQPKLRQSLLAFRCRPSLRDYNDISMLPEERYIKSKGTSEVSNLTYLDSEFLY